MINYEGLFVLLAKKKVPKVYLVREVGINPKTLSRLNQNKSVTLDTLEKICLHFDCKIEDIVEIKKDPVN